MSTTVAVTDEQVESARALVAIAGGPDKVEPLIAKIASASPRARAAADHRAS